jgi:hypothetical protein
MTLEDELALEPLHVPVWAWLTTALAVLAVYALTMENGGLVAAQAENLHEFFHDARHFVGVPCH